MEEIKWQARRLQAVYWFLESKSLWPEFEAFLDSFIEPEKEPEGTKPSPDKWKGKNKSLWFKVPEVEGLEKK